MNGYIHSFESLAALDGEGLRYGVFLSGCPLRCVYCHNPDTWSSYKTQMSPEALVKKVSAYKPYFKDKGGVTFSGGEPLVQSDFIAECVPLLSEKKIGYVIDTSGAKELTDTVKYVLENSQAVLLDLKFPDNESYLKYTGKGIALTLDMLEFLESIGKPVCVRTVVIPGINDSENEIEKYIQLIKGKKCVYKYELLAFHTMGFFKYEKLGIKNPLENTPPLDAEVKDRLQNFADLQLKKFFKENKTVYPPKT